MTIDWWQALEPVIKNAWPYISLISLLIILKAVVEIKLPQKLYRKYKYKNRYIKHKTAHKGPPVMKSHGTEPTLGSGTGSANTKEKSLSERLIAEGGAYVAKKRFMSPSEQKYYTTLLKEYGERYHVMCQVRLLDVIQPNISKCMIGSPSYKALFYQISQWHLDYVLIEKESYKVAFAIELDDRSHNRADRVRRDDILNAIMKDANLKLVRTKLGEVEYA